MPRNKKDKRRRARNKIRVSDVTKQELEKRKVEMGAESFDEVIRREIEKAAKQDKESGSASFMQF